MKRQPCRAMLVKRNTYRVFEVLRCGRSTRAKSGLCEAHRDLPAGILDFKYRGDGMSIEEAKLRTSLRDHRILGVSARRSLVNAGTTEPSPTGANARTVVAPSGVAPRRSKGTRQAGSTRPPLA